MKSKIIKLLVPLLVLGGAYKFLMLPNNDLGYAPEQPIAYSHALHAGTNKIQCQYCHVGVEKGASATVPSLNICMNCHSTVNGKTEQGKADIEKIRAAFARGKEIHWTRVTDLPDHVRFMHKRHIAAGVNCETCHGSIATMEVVEKADRLNMGTCVGCHRDPHSKMKPANPYDKIDVKVGNKESAPTNCGTCHY